MMDILEVLTSRKSIRRYKPDPIPEEMLDKILESARWAPTGENYQPWRFIVVRDPETKRKIGALAKQGRRVAHDRLAVSRGDAEEVENIQIR